MSSRRELANAIRALSMDAVQQAKSGHPGMPMGMADIAEVLWNDFLQHNPANPNWVNRDRFILSNGHGCMLQYSLLHLTGYDLDLEQLRQFRQLHSKTPGHPEFGLTPGVEVTTGPLGQGLANGVGMAIAEKHLAAQFNQPNFDIIDHYTYVFAGDGCLMEGISHEACSLAGTLGLGKLIVLWDDNKISIDGDTHGWFTDDTPKRFESYHWHVIADVDGHDPQAIYNAIEMARSVADKPSIICCRTKIGYGAPTLEGTHVTHGAPLGEEEIEATRQALGWQHSPFAIPDDIYQAYDAKAKGKAREAAWQKLYDDYQQQHPKLAAELQRRLQHQLPASWDQDTQQFINKCAQTDNAIATRKASLNCLNTYTPMLPELIGGSADLSESNCTNWAGSTAFTKKNPSGNYIHYGVREFAMSAIMNGIARHGGLIPFAGTFLTFSDYARNAVRLAAMMKQQVIFIYSHDSIGLGEDGPTHQPIEHLPMLRLTPGLAVWRPCDSTETAVAWKAAIERSDQPTCLLLTRQKVAQQSHKAASLENIARGGYVLFETDPEPQVIIIATGSEVALAMQAATKLGEEGKAVRVVSMPSTDEFDKQPQAYRNSVLPDDIKARVAVEAAHKDYWYKYVGQCGRIIGLDRYGESAPYQQVCQALGITVERILEAVHALLDETSVCC